MAAAVTIGRTMVGATGSEPRTSRSRSALVKLRCVNKLLLIERLTHLLADRGAKTVHRYNLEVHISEQLDKPWFSVERPQRRIETDRDELRIALFVSGCQKINGLVVFAERDKDHSHIEWRGSLVFWQRIQKHSRLVLFTSERVCPDHLVGAEMPVRQTFGGFELHKCFVEAR